MLAECDQLVRDDVLEAEDRATIQSFYNGQDTMSDEEAKKRGQRNVVNHLLGYDSLAAAQRQIESIYHRGSHLWNIELRNLPHDKAHLKSKWEACVREALNKAVKESGRLKAEWKGLAGEITLFGNASLVFRDNYDWCPHMVRPLVPQGSGINADDITHFCIPGSLTLRDLLTAMRSAKARKELGVDQHWNTEELAALIDVLSGSLRQTSASSAFAASELTVDEGHERREMNSGSSDPRRTEIAVYYFYHRENEEREDFSLTILPRITPVQRESLAKAGRTIPSAIYHHPSFFERASHVLHPFFVDCKIGGKTKWHRVMGLGRLNYESDVEIEETFNDAMAGARDNLKRLYAIRTPADWEMLKTWASGNGPSNVLPPGVELADANKQPNFQHAMNPLHFLMQLTRRNASASSLPGAAGGGSSDELEVNAIERQSRNAEGLAARMSDIYDSGDRLGREILRRFLSTDILETDPGYDEIKLFQDALRENGVPLSFLRKMNGCRLENVIVRISRAAGDGNTVKRAMANAALISRLNLFSAGAQQMILRRITAEEMDDYQFAEQVVPYEPKKDTSQMVVATQENDSMDKQGIINYVPPVNDDDLDDQHIEEHMRSMQADLARGKVRPWDNVDLAAFMAKGAHTAAHINRIGANKKRKDLAASYTQQLQKLAKAGQEFARNLNAQQEASREPMTEKDRAALALQQQQLQLKQRAQVKLEEHREKALQLSREKSLVNASLQARSATVQEDMAFHQKMMDRTDRQHEAEGLRMEEEAMMAEMMAQQPETEQPAEVAESGPAQ